ncbi:MAG: YqgE/AlgH family protein [Betaproteobacteria bacterium]|jgi:putative transcriptional regulator|nr:YqgE/AlgH family protein [Betaproteobacteria bacterium]
MNILRFLILACALVGVSAPAWSDDGDAVFLVANPQFNDPTYRHTVLLAAALENGGHIGVIVNRPTNQSLSNLFPEHEPSKKVIDPVYFGGPFSRSALVAVVKRDTSPGRGSVSLMKSLYLAINVGTIDRIIETTPNDARYYVGYVIWRPGELRQEIDRGLWSVQNANADVVLRKDTHGLWEELLRLSRRITASTSHNLSAATGLL